MNPLTILTLIAAALAVMVVYWIARKNEAFGDGIAALCAFVATPFFAVSAVFMVPSTYLQKLFPKPLKREEAIEKDVALHRVGYMVISDMVTAVIGATILAGDTYLAYVFNPSLFGTSEVAISSNVFEWGASFLWVATIAMFGIVALECFGVVKSGGTFPRLHIVARIILGILSLALMVLAIFLVTYAYSYRGVKIFDPTNIFTLKQMGEGILPLLGLLIASASIPALVGVINGLSTAFAILLFVLLVLLQVVAVATVLPAAILHWIALVFTNWRKGIIEDDTYEINPVASLFFKYGEKKKSDLLTPPTFEQPARDWQRQPSYLASSPAPAWVKTDKTKWPTRPLPSLSNILITEDESSHSSAPSSSMSDLSGSSLVEVTAGVSEAGLNGNGDVKKNLIEPAMWPVLVASAPGEDTGKPVAFFEQDGDLDAPYEISLPDRQPFTLTPRNLEGLLQEVFSELEVPVSI